MSGKTNLDPSRLIIRLCDEFIEQEQNDSLKEIQENFRVTLRDEKDIYLLADKFQEAMMDYVTSDKQFRSLKVLRYLEKDGDIYLLIERKKLDIVFLDEDVVQKTYLALKINNEDDRLSFVTIVEPIEDYDETIDRETKVGDILMELECGIIHGYPNEDLPFA